MVVEEEGEEEAWEVTHEVGGTRGERGLWVVGCRWDDMMITFLGSFFSANSL
jgi:hypothetical protein